METRNRKTLWTGLVVGLEEMDVLVGTRGWHRYQIVRHPGGVGVLPLHEDGTVTLIRQLRPAVDAFLLEIPAGRLHPGEPPAECGARELAEETGLSARELFPLGSFLPSPGVFDEEIHLFLGRGLVQGEAEPESYEEIDTVRIPFAEALRQAREGEISDGKTIVAIIRAQAVLGR